MFEVIDTLGRRVEMQLRRSRPVGVRGRHQFCNVVLSAGRKPVRGRGTVLRWRDHQQMQTQRRELRLRCRLQDLGNAIERLARRRVELPRRLHELAVHRQPQRDEPASIAHMPELLTAHPEIVPGQRLLAGAAPQGKHATEIPRPLGSERL